MISPQEDLRAFLSEPFGILFFGETFWKTDIPRKFKVVTVGDFVTVNYIKHLGEAPPLAFADLKTKRKLFDSVGGLVSYFNDIYRIKNPPGSVLIGGIVETLLEATVGFPEAKSLVIVDGEEDLIPLALPYVNFPDDTVVVYGQPNAGVVAYRLEQIALLKTCGVNAAARYYLMPLKILRHGNRSAE